MPEKNLLEQEREPRTNSTHMWRQRQDSNLNHPKLKSTVKLQVVAAVSFSMRYSSKQTVFFFLFFFISGTIKLVFSSCFYMTSMMYF